MAESINCTAYEEGLPEERKRRKGCITALIIAAAVLVLLWTL